MKIVFVCTGNICRSLMAELLFNDKAKKLSRTDLEARSAGIAAEGCWPVPGGVKRAMAELGIEGFSHTPQLSARPILSWADTVVAMSQEHYDHLADQFPEFSRKLSLFSDWSEDRAGDVEDPYGRPDPVFKTCRDRLERGIGRFLEKHEHDPA